MCTLYLIYMSTSSIGGQNNIPLAQTLKGLDSDSKLANVTTYSMVAEIVKVFNQDLFEHVHVADQNVGLLSNVVSIQYKF